MERVIQGKNIVAGNVKGRSLVSDKPLSFWGGYNQSTGEIIDRRHPLSGKNASGNILVIPHSRGSTTTTAVLLEAMFSNKAPAAILTRQPDSFFALASIVAEEMFGKTIPVIELNSTDFQELENDQWLEINGEGEVSFHKD